MSADSTVPHFANQAGSLCAHPGHYAVLRFHGGEWSGEMLAELFGRTGELLLTHGWSCLLIDARLLQHMPDPLRAWLDTSFLGADMRRPPVLHLLVVLPEGLHPRISTTRLGSEGEAITTYRYYTTAEAAHTTAGYLSE